ncbi:hypothetical protein HNR22_004896 [Micromonospora jinlongensis]|uniref:Uncharacterized protein n=1 Tax=Micromonospora jinlongensis TaxID=1287877 RepID=A0A7Y9X4R8_9ACTN|nr:hypothetical protein [Micromonospora jinlongensis]NYH45169.1 hypothetical protein [Micromonospora jinlongensis]
MRKSDKKRSSSPLWAPVRVPLKWLAATVALAVVATTGPATADGPDHGPGVEPTPERALTATGDETVRRMARTVYDFLVTPTEGAVEE